MGPNHSVAIGEDVGSLVTSLLGLVYTHFKHIDIDALWALPSRGLSHERS